MKIYSIVLVDKYKEEYTLAHTTTKEKAKEILLQGWGGCIQFCNEEDEQEYENME